MAQSVSLKEVDASEYSGVFTYDKWMESTGVPIHRGYYIEDLRTVELGWWTERDCNTAFVQLEGMQGICETRITEIAPAQTLPPLKLGVDEVVYVLQGNGLGSVWTGDKPHQNFEWGPHSLFLIPRHRWVQLSNARGDTPIRLMHFNYLPLAMSGSNDANFFFNNPYEEREQDAEVYAEATVSRMLGDRDDPFLWMGNFFPDLRAWDKLAAYQKRGAGGHHMQIKFPNTEMVGHMSVFDARLYKKAHRHGPGRAIVIPAGEGYSVMWANEDAEKVIIPWHEGSFFVPPDQWFHQHFNAGATPARYLALHPAPVFRGMMSEKVDRAADQIDYTQEEPWIRQKFADELAKRGTTSLMPEECYQVPDYEWSFKTVYNAPAG